MLAACAPFPKASYAPPAPLAEDAHPAPISLARLRYRLPTGSEVGSRSEGWCGLKSPVGKDDLRGTIQTEDIKDSFHDTLASLGYDVTGAPDLVFDEDIEDDMLRAEYRIAGDIIDARTDVCYRGAQSPLLWFAGRPGFTGQLFLKIRWHVYDSLRRASVYTVETDGYAKRAVPNPDGVSLLVTSAFTMAAHNLASNDTFRDLIVHGVKPVKDAANLPDRSRRYDPGATLTLPRLPLSTRAFADQAEEKRKAAVMVQASSGHGSGFFIGSMDIITAAHVVGDALHVRVTLADRAESITAEVVRADKGRDVALLRLTAAPSAPPVLLPVRAPWPRVGEKVYAIGAPRDRRLQDSVTSGIVSAWRKEFKILGTRRNFIQSDVTVQPGNSGGPLLDQYGNIVGIDDAGLQINDNSTGLNYFIPVAEALDALGVTLR